VFWLGRPETDTCYTLRQRGHVLPRNKKAADRSKCRTEIDGQVSNTVRPIRTAHLDNPAGRLAERPTGPRSLSKQTLDSEEISVARYADTELKR